MAILIFGLPSAVFVFLIAMLCCLTASSDEGDHVEHEDNAEQREINEDEKESDEVVAKSTRLKED